MELSPFDFTGPLPPERVTGRDDLLGELTRRVTARTPTALLGPRRFGKTSVLGRLAADLTEVTTIVVDLMPVQAPHDAVRAVTAALLDADTHVREEATAVSAKLGFNLLALRGEIATIRAADRPDPSVAFANLIDTLVRTALAGPTVVVFDEFQQIAALDNGTAVLRSALQRHYKDIGLLFAGSAPSAMRDIFSNPGQPFLHQADIVEIGPLTLEATQQLIADGFAETGRTPGTVASLIHAHTDGHPLRTMQAAHVAWQYAEDGPADTAWGDALAAIRTAGRPAVSALYEQLPTSQQKVLRILANGGSIYGSAAAALDLSKGGAQQASRSLHADGHLLDDASGSSRVADPFLADWLQLAYPL